MTVYEIPNIEHCDVVPVQSGDIIYGYRVNSHTGWYIHLAEHDELTYKTAVILNATYNMANVQIVAEADLPEGAEILANGNETVTE